MSWFCVFHFVVLLSFAVIVKLTVTVTPASVLTGSFWHITDLHFDKNYSRTGDPADLCHEGNSTSHDNGYFGNVLCDSPENLIDLTVKDMKRLAPKPDFIIWTGDNLAHTRNPNPSWDAVFQSIRYITLLLNDTFGDVKIFPSLGNHDSFPPNILLPSNGNHSIYDDYLEKGAWDSILPRSTLDTFRRGGFYSYVLKKLRIISLNTILWYETNPSVKNLTDPAGQLQWLTEELENASLAGQKVYIIGHVSPGFYNRVLPGTLSTPTFHLQYLKSYLKIVKEHPSVISGQMFGHVHNDMFQLYFCNTGVALASSLIASSVTPWHSDHNKYSLPVNPSIRLMDYDKRKYTLQDYKQYFFNLTLGNMEPQKVSYELLYTFSKVYGVPDLSTKSLVTVYEKLKKSSELYNIFYYYLTSAMRTAACDKACRSAQLCSISCTSESEYSACMHKTDGGDVTPAESNDHSRVLAYAISIPTIIILTVFILIVYHKTKPWCRRRHTYRDFSNL